MVVADPKSKNRSGIPAAEYLGAFFSAQEAHANAQLIGLMSGFTSGGADFFRADYKTTINGTTLYNSMICTERSGYFLSWNFVTPSQQDLDDAVNTIQHVSFDRASAH